MRPEMGSSGILPYDPYRLGDAGFHHTDPVDLADAFHERNRCTFQAGKEIRETLVAIVGAHSVDQREVVRHRHHEHGNAGRNQQRNAQDLRSHGPQIAHHLDVEHVHHVTSSALICLGLTSSRAMRPPLRRRIRVAIPAIAELCVMTTVVVPSSALTLAMAARTSRPVSASSAPGRLVAQQNVGALDDGAGDRDALLLAARKLRWEVIETLR